MPEIQVDWYSKDEADRLRDLRDRHGMVWRGVLLEGAKHAESIDLLKALVELHPALAHARPGDHAGISAERSAVTEQLRKQVQERQRARSTTGLPSSAFTEAGSKSCTESVGVADEDTDGAQRIDVSEAVARMQKNRANRVQGSVTSEPSQAPEYEHWDVQGARPVDGDAVLPTDAHDDVDDALRHTDHREQDEWDVVDPTYEYENYGREYDGDFR